jgi:hypothetical protein
VASSDFDCYYGEAVTSNTKCDDVEKRKYPLLSITETADPRNPFADPILPPIDESIIRRAGSPDSDYISVDRSSHPAPRDAQSFPPTDYYLDRSFLPEPSSLQDSVLSQDETHLEQGPAVQRQFKR